MSTMTSSSACGITSLPAAISGNGPGRPGQQCAQRILRLAQDALQRGYGRQRAEILRLRLLHIQFGVVAALEQPLGDLQAASLQGGIFASDHEPRLHGADRTVEAGHLGGHQHLHVIVLGDAGEIAGVRGLDAAPELAPEIEFPADLKPAFKATAVSIRRTDLCSPRAERFAGCLLHLRVERAAGNPELRARFHDAHAGDAHVRDSRAAPRRPGDRARDL